MSNKPWRLSVRVLIQDDEGRFLMMKRSNRSKSNIGRWEPPGGKIDAGESFDEALVREVAEETGLTISIKSVAGAVSWEMTKLRIIQLIMEGSVESGQLHLSNEHNAYSWVRPEEFSTLELADWFESFAMEMARKASKVNMVKNPSK
ncbi:MAG: NUDIX domain-containing protein [Candidatus Bathyarchaeia archaeon]|jgi:8-oxo-dGTP diphosphatase